MANTYRSFQPLVDQLIVDAQTNAVVGIRSRNAQNIDFLPGAQVNLPPTQYTAISTASGVYAASAAIGAQDVFLQSSGATALTTPTAAASLAVFTGATALPNGGVGMSYVLRIINTNAGTLTITPDASVTITGTATIATNTWREFIVSFPTATTSTWQAIGTGTQS